MKTQFSPKELLAPANIVSLSRIPLSVLIIIFYEFKLLVFALLSVAVLSDAVDGYLARKRGSTVSGAIIDVACDKVMVGMLMVFFLVSRIISVEGLALFLLRDIFILLVSVFLLLSRGRHALSLAKARWSGKTVTVAQFAAMMVLLFLPAYWSYMVCAVAALSLMAIFDYSIAIKKSL